MPTDMEEKASVGFAEPWTPEDLSSDPSNNRRKMNSRRSTTAEVIKMVHDHQIDPDNGNRYFIGPRDPRLHSKLPYALRLHGSILPKMLVALAIMAVWSVIVTVISKTVFDLGISPLLLTVLGFLVGLSLSYLNSTAYERYSDGRKTWSNISLASRNLARMTWIFVEERDGEAGKQDLIGKVSAINLILAFAISLKHRLRFEPYAQYPDLASLISHLDTFAKTAFDEEKYELHRKKPKSTLHLLGDYLGLPFLMDDERIQMKESKRPLGNLPLEILTYLTAYYSTHIAAGPLKNTAVLGNFLNQLTMLSDSLTQAERVLNTPLPEAYSIVISQITIIYVFALPFQLYPSLGWITIPATIASSYIILGIALIAHEIENPFGHDVNDLPLDTYCLELAHELDSLTSMAPPKPKDFIMHPENMVLWPLSGRGVGHWGERGEEDIREGLSARVVVGRGKRVF